MFKCEKAEKYFSGYSCLYRVSLFPDYSFQTFQTSLTERTANFSPSNFSRGSSIVSQMFLLCKHTSVLERNG